MKYICEYNNITYNIYDIKDISYRKLLVVKLSTGLAKTGNAFYFPTSANFRMKKVGQLDSAMI